MSSLELDIKQRLYEKLQRVIYKELCNMEVDYVEQGERFIIGSSEFKGLQIIIKVEIK